MIHALIDPGSAVVAVGIFDDAAALPFVTRYLDARTFEVGEKTIHDPPLTGFYADKKRADGTVIPGAPWTRHETREVTEAHEQEAAEKVVAYLLASGVEEVTIERIAGAFGDTVPELIRKSKFLVSTARIASSITARCKLLGIAVAPGPLAVTWRARLAPLVRDHGGNVAGPAIRGKGGALDPVLVALIQDWPERNEWSAEHLDHVRVCGGMALWSVLPALPGRVRKAGGTPRVRSEAAEPRERLTVEELRARRAAKKLRVATDSAAKKAALRLAGGCTCPRKHRATCPMFAPSKVTPRVLPATCRVCYRPIAAHARPCAA